MKFKEFVGIDVSKSHVDIFLHLKKKHIRLSNRAAGFEKMMNWLQHHHQLAGEQVLFALEHTGLYSLPLSLFLDEHGCFFSLIPGLEIKRSRGIVRGKNDKADAKGIAEYAYEKRDRIKRHVMPSLRLRKLKKLLAFRERLVKERTAFKGRLKEYEAFLDTAQHKVLIEGHYQMMGHLNQQIKTVEMEMNRLIKEDQQLVQQYRLINSIKGVGPQTAFLAIVLTSGFYQFKDWRKFASYSGIAPFPNQSGKMIKKTSVSHLAHKRMKSLLSRCACSAIKYNPEMKMYYEARVAQGKNKMSTLNIIRNKLVARIFAVVKRQTPYVEIFNYAA